MFPSFNDESARDMTTTITSDRQELVASLKNKKKKKREADY